MSIQDELPKSRLTLRYRTEIHGQPEDIELPLRLLVLGDFSGGYTKKTKEKALEEREVLSLNGKNTTAIMEKMQMCLKVTDGEEQEHTLPITSMDSFWPTHISENIDSLQHLLNGRKALKDVLSLINNSKKFRRAISELVIDREVIKNMKGKLESSYKEAVEIPFLFAANNQE